MSWAAPDSSFRAFSLPLLQKSKSENQKMEPQKRFLCRHNSVQITEMGSVKNKAFSFEGHEVI